MTLDDLTARLESQGALLSTTGLDRLVVKAPRGLVSPEILAALAEYKAALLERLSGTQPRRRSMSPPCRVRGGTPLGNLGLVGTRRGPDQRSSGPPS